jgi:hypothetical protein
MNHFIWISCQCSSTNLLGKEVKFTDEIDFLPFSDMDYEEPDVSYSVTRPPQFGMVGSMTECKYT